MASMWQDVRYGLRMLKKTLRFTAIAMITLAIGIGANTTMFSMSDLLFFRPIKVKDAQQLICCNILNLSFGGIPYSAYLMLRDSNPIFNNLMAQDNSIGHVTLVHKDMTRKANTSFVSANYFSFLGVAPILGRGFLPEEERQVSSPAVVLSYRAWQQQGGEPEIVGQFVSINGIRCQVIGVAPEGFTGMTIIGPDLWLPLGSYLSVDKLSKGYTRPVKASSDWDYPDLILVGRLKPGLNMVVAQQQLQLLVPRIKETFSNQWNPNCSFYLQRPPKIIISNDADHERAMLAGFSLVLMGVSAAILIIACMNLSNMMIIQGAGRHREIAIRLALGGSRLRIIRQLLIESLLLALLGGVLGLVLAFWGTRVLNAWISTMAMITPEMGGSLRIGLSIRVLVATLGFSLVATLLFGLRPALGLSRCDLITDLKESGSTIFLSFRRKWGNLSILCQIALAVILVLGATLFTRSALLLAQPNPSFRMDNKLVIEVDPLSAGYDRFRSAQVCEALADHLASLSGVEALGMSTKFFFGGGGPMSIYEYAPGGEGNESRRHLGKNAALFDVGRNYFAALELPLLQGHSFKRLDSTADAEKVMIIDESLARKLSPDGKALGCLIQYGLFSQYSEPYRVVGIIPNVQGVSEVRQINAQMYRPIQPDQLCPYFYLRFADSESAAVLKRRISEEIHKVDPYVPVLSVATLAQKHQENPPVWFGRCGARLAQTAGTMALFLAALGIYAIKGYMVTSRTSELGIRKALGATTKDIVVMVLLEGMVLTIIGLIVGLLLGLGAARIMASVFYGVSPVDPVSIVVSVVLLGAASLLASYIPAQRAAKIDPMEALRYE